MPLERIDSYFNGAVESYDERLKRSAEDEDGYIRRTAEFFPKKEHLHILDIGIGTGTGLTAILEQNPTIYVDGIDCADKMLSEIPKNLPTNSRRRRCMRTSAVPSLSRSARSSICRQTSITIALRRSMWRAKRRCFSKRALQRYACAGRNPTRQCFLPQNKQITVEKPVELRTNKRYAS